MNTLPTILLSKLDNPNGILPMAVKDGIDNCGRTYAAYNENLKGGKVDSAKHEARERWIEETATSVVWLGGIPFFRKLIDKTYFALKGINPELDLRLISDKYKNSVQHISNLSEQALSKHEILKDVANNPKKYTNNHIGKVLFATVASLFLLTRVIPKFNQNLTKEKILNKNNPDNQVNPLAIPPLFYGKTSQPMDKKASTVFASFIKPNEVSFTGRFSDFVNQNFNPLVTAQKAQINPTANMLLLDLGLSTGRLINARNNDERAEIAFRETGIIFFFFFAADIIKDKLEKIADKFKLPIKLDTKILQDKNFSKATMDKDFLKFIAPDEDKAAKIKKHLENKLTKKGVKEAEKEANKLFTKMVENRLGSENKILNFIKNQLANEEFTTSLENGKVNFKFNNQTLEAARKTGLIDVIKDKNGKFTTNPLKFIDTAEILNINKNLKEFTQMFKEKQLKDSGLSIEKFIKMTGKAKVGSILLNMAICSVSLAYILPKIQYYIREKRTGSCEFTGIKEYQQEAQKLSNNQSNPFAPKKLENKAA